jgi:SpoVK/Ycf46/Vps4 family AAA+-type ATPase
MVGLTEAKKVINQALTYYKAQKLFKQKGMDTGRPAMHMVFTGNPGTAKTTVARLFAAIMRDNGLLTRGELHEVGRADLVGKYLGYTAQIVKKQFADARGSVLFIDEAYSLVDDRNGLYGDEAINTIVQEMENSRDDMVVIFAGYPDKMEEFLSRNPGLKSRIAFHINFDDYTAEELVEISALIAEGKGLKLDDGAKQKLLPIFEEARKDADFGNGRYARNVIEKAQMQQAERLVKMDFDDVTRDDIETIIAGDIIVRERVVAKSTRVGF